MATRNFATPQRSFILMVETMDKPKNLVKCVTTSRLGTHIYECTDKAILERTPSDRKDLVRAVVDWVRAYQSALQNLLSDKYSTLRGVLPAHYSTPGITLLTFCSDGLLVRFNKPSDLQGIGVCWMDCELETVSPVLSDGFVYCYKTNEDFDPATGGITITLSLHSPGGAQKTIATVKAAMIADLSTERPPGHQRPYLVAEATDVLQIELHGLMGDQSEDLRPSQAPESTRFVLESKIPLSVGWTAIQIYPSLIADEWDPKLADTWAEKDILSAHFRYEDRERHFRDLDPNFGARKAALNLISQFQEILSSAEREHDLHVFLRDNPRLVCPSFKRAWSKVAFGTKVSDLVFLGPTGEYLLVELEKADKTLFTAKGKQHAELTEPIDQITDWRRYIEDNISTVHRELGLRGMGPNVKGLVVIGRSASLSEGNRRKLATIQGQTPGLRILTYDDILTEARTTFENMLGPLVDQPGGTRMFLFGSDSGREVPEQLQVDSQ